ncbi:MAG: FimV/HubP family polar landmark protein [Porticoccaceae bacterium]
MITGAARRWFSTIIRWVLAAVSIAPLMVVALDVNQTSASITAEAQEQSPVAVQSTNPVEAERTHRVVDGDTLWNVAKRLRPSYMSIAATMDLLYATNPEAFLDGDSTKLQKGYLLSFTPPAVQSAAVTEIAESIDTSPVIPRVDNPVPAPSVIVDSAQAELESGLVNEETTIARETIPVTPELTPELAPQQELSAQSKAQAQSQREPDQGDLISVESSDGFDSQIDKRRESVEALHNQPSQPQISDSALESTSETSTGTTVLISVLTSAESSDSQKPSAVVPSDAAERQIDASQATVSPPLDQQLQPQNPVATSEFGSTGVETKPRSSVDMAAFNAVWDGFRRNPPYTAMVAALLALVFIVLGVRRLRKPLAASEGVNRVDHSQPQQSDTAVDMGSSDAVEGADSLTDSVLSGPFAADPADDSGIFADADVDIAESTSSKKPANTHSSEADLPGQKALQAQMGDELTELPSTDLTTDSDTEYLDYMDPFKVKLDMATLCAEMGDSETAREILQEIISEADQAGRAQAQAVLDQLDD